MKPLTLIFLTLLLIQINIAQETNEEQQDQLDQDLESSRLEKKKDDLTEQETQQQKESESIQKEDQIQPVEKNQDEQTQPKQEDKSKVKNTLSLFDTVSTPQELEELLKMLKANFTTKDKDALPELFGNIDAVDEILEIERVGKSTQGSNKSKKETPTVHTGQLVPDIMSEWGELMTNFNPDDMISFELQPGQTEVLYQEITQPTTIRGAYFISFIPEQNKIDFEIKRLDNIVLYTKQNAKENIFSLEIKEPGEYKFVFTSKRSSDPFFVNFALDVHNASTEYLQQQNIDPFTLRLERIHLAMRDNFFEAKFTQQRQDQGWTVLNQTHSKLLIFTLFETLGIFTITLWQVYYIKRILDTRRLI